MAKVAVKQAAVMAGETEMLEVSAVGLMAGHAEAVKGASRAAERAVAVAARKAVQMVVLMVERKAVQMVAWRVVPMAARMAVQMVA